MGSEMSDSSEEAQGKAQTYQHDKDIPDFLQQQKANKEEIEKREKEKKETEGS
jgi:hypothetical protein